ncbi:MAG: G5 domain-containing protein [Clostridia bacterium]|nr:G5 domain-containing protein [Clostridia bacterium]
MLEKIEFRLSEILFSKQIRVKCIAVLTAVTVAVISLLGLSINTVNVFDGEKNYVVRSLNLNVSSVLSGLNLKSDRYKVLQTTSEGHITSVKIAYTFPVFVTNGENVTELDFAGGTVADALALAGYTVDEFDMVQPSPETEITETAYIDYTDIEYVNGTYTEVIPHGEETVYSSAHAAGVTKTEDGTDGLKQVSYTEKLVNGVFSEKTVTGEEVLQTAVNSKTIVGTKKAAPVKTAAATSSTVKSVSTLTPSSPIELDENGAPLHYKSKMTARATAYTYTGHNCATGIAPQPGYIAVNPNVIPYGTKMYIKTADGSVIYGYAVAADTGGFIKNHPTGVDLFMSNRAACVSFGVRNVEIYILE